jgi:hypothetical protein
MRPHWTRLRTLSTVGGVILVTFVLWAYTRYETVGVGILIPNLILGVIAIALPMGVPHAKFQLRRVMESYVGSDPEQSHLFKSTDRVPDAERALDTVAESLADDSEHTVTRKSFSQGPGLVITYKDFHNSFVRRLRSGHLAVTGDGDRTSSLADRVERLTSITFERTTPSQVKAPTPVSGLARVTVALVVFALLLSGVMGVLGSAYPSSAYNPAEKAVLVSFDARSDFDPTMSPTDARLGKAAFLVDVLDEKAVEIRIAKGKERILDHARQSLVISRDANLLLDDVDRASPTSEQRARIERLQRDLRSERKQVAKTITERIRDEKVADAEAKLVRIRDMLLARA